jgi:hypothetical protein
LSFGFSSVNFITATPCWLFSARPIGLLCPREPPLGLASRGSPHLESLDALDFLELGQILHDFMGIQEFSVERILKKYKESGLFLGIETTLGRHLLYVHAEAI